eukprot:IDg15632t1
MKSRRKDMLEVAASRTMACNGVPSTTLLAIGRSNSSWESAIRSRHAGPLAARLFSFWYATVMWAPRLFGWSLQSDSLE